MAATVQEARDVLEHERVAAVLLDLVLDEHEDSGFDLLVWIRQHHPGLPVIVLSAAQVNSASIRRAYELGASSYFVKGNVPMAHIYSDLAARLVERGTGRPGTYRFGRLEFDPTRRTVTMGERSVRLTQQQAAVVLFLWLMREERSSGVRRKAGGEAGPPGSDASPPTGSSPNA